MKNILKMRELLFDTIVKDVEQGFRSTNKFYLLFTSESTPVVCEDEDLVVIEGGLEDSVDLDESDVFIDSISDYIYGTNITDSIPISEIIKIPNSSMDVVMAVLEEMTLNDDLYGILITNGKGDFLNPGHPLVAAAIKERGIEYWFKDGRFTAMLYPYTDSVPILTNGSDAMFQKLPGPLQFLPSPKVDIDTSSIPRDPLLEAASFTRRASQLNIPKMEIIGMQKWVIAPVQIAIHKGVAFPWYGVVKKEKGRTQGYNMGPMMSVNISIETDEIKDKIYQYGDDTWYIDREPGDICTGSAGPASSDAAFASLNCCNMDSAHHTIATTVDIVNIKRQAAQRSISILKEKK